MLSGGAGAAHGARRRSDQARAVRPDRLAGRRGGAGRRRPTRAAAGTWPTCRCTWWSSDQRDFETSSTFAAEWRERVGPVVEAKSMQFNFNMGPSAGRPVDVEISAHATTRCSRQAANGRRRGAARLRRGDGRRERGGARQAAARPDAAAGGGEPGAHARRTSPARCAGRSTAAEALRQQDGRNEVRVLVRLPNAERRNENDISDLLIRTPAGRRDRAARGGGDQARAAAGRRSSGPTGAASST
jgi:hypothetical protein